MIFLENIKFTQRTKNLIPLEESPFITIENRTASSKKTPDLSCANALRAASIAMILRELECIVVQPGPRSTHTAVTNQSSCQPTLLYSGGWNPLTPRFEMMMICHHSSDGRRRKNEHDFLENTHHCDDQRNFKPVSCFCTSGSISSGKNGGPKPHASPFAFHIRFW